MSREAYTVTIDGWERLGGGLDHNRGDHPKLEPHRLQLVEMTERARALVVRRNALEAEKQAVTAELQGILNEGRRLASLLRHAMRLAYGTRSEKLVEFGLRPFRRRSRST